MRTALLLLLALISTGSLRAKNDLYPAGRQETRVLFYVLEGELEPRRLRDAVGGLGEGVEIIHGPASKVTQKELHFIALEVPADLEEKRVTRGLKKSRTRPELLNASVIEITLPAPPGGENPFGGGGSLSDMIEGAILGLHGDLRWFEASADRATFFFERNRLDAALIIDRITKMVEPYAPLREVPELTTDTIEWSLVTPLDARTLRKVEKRLERTKGVVTQNIEPTTGLLSLQVQMDGVSASGPTGTDGVWSGNRGPSPWTLRPTFDTTEVLEVLADEGLALVLADGAGEEGEGASEADPPLPR